MKTSKFLIILLILSSLFSGCAITNKFGPYMGKVVDAETKEPIEGAVIFIRCSTLTGTPGGATTHYADAKEVLTDKKGEFTIELRATTFRLGHLWDRYPHIMVFKPGYGLFPDHRNSDVDIKDGDTSYSFPTNLFVTISLPRLHSRRERAQNVSNVTFTANIPIIKWENLFKLRNAELKDIGLKERSNPKGRDVQND